MKNAIKLITLIVLITIAVLPAVAGGSSDKTGKAKAVAVPAVVVEPGKLTITGLDAYNGMRIQASVERGDGGNRKFEAFSHYVEDYDPMLGDQAGAVITNGSATLNVWLFEVASVTQEEWGESANYNDPVRYTGNDMLRFFVNIWGGENEIFHFHFAEASGYVTVQFDKGIGKGVFVEAE